MEQEPQLRAFVVHDVAAARTQIPRADGPLRGLPFAAKDNLDSADFPTACGSAIYEGHRPASDAACIARAKAAGAVCIGKTAMAEFALIEPAPTRNPRDMTRTPGGSSSGSAAAVAAGMLPFAIGTQTAGSVIRPAAFCGVAAYKPTFGLLPTSGVKPVAHTLDTLGIFAADVQDAAFVASAVIGGHPALTEDSSPPRIGICPSWAGLEPSAEAAFAFQQATKAAERACASLVDITLPSAVEQVHFAHEVIMGFEAARALAVERSAHRPSLSRRLADFLDHSAGVPPEDYVAALVEAAEGRRQISSVFAEVDIVVTPSARDCAPKGLSDTGSSAFNRLWTLLHLPAVNVPGMTAPSGLPLGVQVIGPAHEDARTLSASAFLQTAIQRYVSCCGDERTRRPRS